MIHIENNTTPQTTEPLSPEEARRKWNEEILPGLMAIAEAGLSPAQLERIDAFQRDNDRAVAKMMLTTVFNI